MRGLQFRFPKQTTPHPRTCVCVCVCVRARASIRSIRCFFLGETFSFPELSPAPPHPRNLLRLSLSHHISPLSLSHTRWHMRTRAQRRPNEPSQYQMLSLFFFSSARVCVCVSWMASRCRHQRVLAPRPDPLGPQMESMMAPHASALATTAFG